MASPSDVGSKNEALQKMQQAGGDAASALNAICMVLDEIALDMSFARHANRMPLRLSSSRIENVARTLMSEVNAQSPVGAKHASMVGRVALAAATVSVLPFAEDAGQAATCRFKAAHGRAMKNLEWVDQYAESAQSETRRELNLQITALVMELDRLAAKVGMEMTQQRRELDEAMHMRQLPAGWALESVGRVVGQISVGAQRVPQDGAGGSFCNSTSDYLYRLTEIKFKIAEIFAQLTGDDI
jgi:hypothetical protein